MVEALCFSWVKLKYGCDYSTKQWAEGSSKLQKMKRVKLSSKQLQEVVEVMKLKPKLKAQCPIPKKQDQWESQLKSRSRRGRNNSRMRRDRRGRRRRPLSRK